MRFCFIVLWLSAFADHFLSVLFLQASPLSPIEIWRAKTFLSSGMGNVPLPILAWRSNTRQSRASWIFPTMTRSARSVIWHRRCWLEIWMWKTLRRWKPSMSTPPRWLSGKSATAASSTIVSALSNVARKSNLAHSRPFLGPAEDYELPYLHDVPGDPDVAQMKEIVFTRRKRPMIHNQWSTREVCYFTNGVKYFCAFWNQFLIFPKQRRWIFLGGLINASISHPFEVGGWR